MASLDGTALEQVVELSRHFRVSATACAYRLLGLNLLLPPAAVLRWTREGEPAGRRLSDDTAQLTHRYRQLAASPPLRSVTAAAIHAAAPGRHSGRTPALYWFPHLSGLDRGDDLFLQEDVMSLGRHGFLTLLHAESAATIPAG